MQDLSVAELVKQLPTISAGKRYWFVRTNSGQYYKYFIDKGIIAMGYNEITIAEIDKVKKIPDKAVDILGLVIGDKFKELKRAKYHASQLLAFSTNMIS